MQAGKPGGSAGDEGRRVSTTGSRIDHVKRSFLQLPVPVDVERLLRDYRALPSEAWTSTHWDTHCSSNMVLLRGGRRGTEDDFVSTDTVEHEVLRDVPYMAWLIGDSGPFGGATYAFIFRMKPLGVSRPHTDDNPAWFEPFRVHVPITTNDGALLLSEGRSKHLGVGEVWTFDNQARHAVVNGDVVRAHLIFDVPRRPELLDLLERARFDPGEPDPANWRRAGLPDTVPTVKYATSTPLSTPEKERLGLDAGSFASRVDVVLPPARVARVDLRVGDVVCAVNGVTECAVARTVTDYLQVRHRPGDVVELRVVRDGVTRNVRARLYARPRVADRITALKRRLTGTNAGY